MKVKTLNQNEIILVVGGAHCVCRGGSRIGAERSCYTTCENDCRSICCDAGWRSYEYGDTGFSVLC